MSGSILDAVKALREALEEGEYTFSARIESRLIDVERAATPPEADRTGEGDVPALHKLLSDLDRRAWRADEHPDESDPAECYRYAADEIRRALGIDPFNREQVSKAASEARALSAPAAPSDRQATIAAAIDVGVKALTGEPFRMRQAFARDVATTVVVATLDTVVDAVPRLTTSAPTQPPRTHEEALRAICHGATVGVGAEALADVARAALDTPPSEDTDPERRAEIADVLESLANEPALAWRDPGKLRDAAAIVRGVALPASAPSEDEQTQAERWAERHHDSLRALFGNMPLAWAEFGPSVREKSIAAMLPLVREARAWQAEAEAQKRIADLRQVALEEANERAEEAAEDEDGAVEVAAEAITEAANLRAEIDRQRPTPAPLAEARVCGAHPAPGTRMTRSETGDLSRAYGDETCTLAPHTRGHHSTGERVWSASRHDIPTVTPPAEMAVTTGESTPEDPTLALLRKVKDGVAISREDEARLCVEGLAESIETYPPTLELTLRGKRMLRGELTPSGD